MKQTFVFYRALDPVKGSWDGYGYFAAEEDVFFAYVSDAPSGASINTAELMKLFFNEHFKTSQAALESDPAIAKIEIADLLNRLQAHLIRQGRADGTLYQAALAAVYQQGTKLYSCCIGDSIAALFRNSRIYRLTTSEVWDGGLIFTAGKTVSQRQKVREIEFLGSGGKFIEPTQIQVTNLRPGDQVVLHSDGFEDLVNPEQIAAACTQTSETLKKQLESTFAQEKIKDDVTFLKIEPDVPAQLDLQSEFRKLSQQMESLQKEQQQFRNDLAKISTPAGRLEKLQSELQDVKQQLSTFSKQMQNFKAPKASVPLKSSAPQKTSDFAVLRKPWLWVVVILFLAVSMGLSYYWGSGGKTLNTTRTTYSKKPVKKTFTPEVTQQIKSSERDCLHTVQKGDSLQKIATTNSLTVDQLLQMNPGLQKKSSLRVGQTLKLCGDEP